MFKLAVKEKLQACILLGSFGIAGKGLGLVATNKFDSGLNSKKSLIKQTKSKDLERYLPSSCFKGTDIY